MKYNLCLDNIGNKNDIKERKDRGDPEVASQETTSKSWVKAQSAANHRPLELGLEPAHNGDEKARVSTKSTCNQQRSRSTQIWSGDKGRP